MEWFLGLLRTKIHTKYSREFSESNVESNRNRSIVISLLIAVLELVILASTYIGSVGAVYGDYLALYRCLYFLMSIASILGFLALQGFKNHSNAYINLTRTLMVILVIFMNWAVLISIVDAVRGIQSYFYIFVAMTISVIVTMRPIRGFLLFGLSLLVYLSLTFAFVTDPLIAFSNYVNGFSGYATSWIISMLFYKHRTDDFLKQKIIFEQNDQLKHIANNDPLTGIYNRRALETEMTRIFEKSLAFKTGMLVMMIDIDYYKGFNDTYGHIQGDQVLIQVANTLRDMTSDMDKVICRYGGDEFCLILECDSESEAQRFRDLIHEEIRRLAIVNKASKISSYITVSIGIRYVIPLDGDSPWIYVDAADKDLYTYKSERMNRRMND